MFVTIPLVLAIGMLVAFAGDGLASDFFPDDLMNMYGYWQRSWSEVLAANLLFWEDGYRPLGAVFYKPLFHTFGLNPVPYRVVCVALLLFNLILAYRLLVAVTSHAIAAVAVVVLSYHAYFSDLYYSSATIYDLMAYGLFYGFLLFYLQYRRGASRSHVHLIALLVLFVLGWNAKEIFGTLPLIVLAIEVFFFRRGDRDFRVFCASAVLTAIILAAKVVSGTALTDNPAYQPSLTFVLPNITRYAGMMLYVSDGISADKVIFFVALAGVGVWRWGDAASRLAWLIGCITPIPVLLIAPRSFYVFYISFLGWSLLGAVLLVRLLSIGMPSIQRKSIALAALTMLLLIPLHIKNKPAADAWRKREEFKVRTTLAQAGAAVPTLPRGARILFLADPVDADDWLLTFCFRLLYRDPTIEVHRAKRGDPADSQIWPSYAYVLDFADWNLRCIRPNCPT